MSLNALRLRLLIIIRSVRSKPPQSPKGGSCLAFGVFRSENNSFCSPLYSRCSPFGGLRGLGVGRACRGRGEATYNPNAFSHSFPNGLTEEFKK